MPRRPNDVPSYLHHKPTDQAYVRLPDAAGGRRVVYLGAFNSPASRAEYARLVAELNAAPASLPTSTGFVPAAATYSTPYGFIPLPTPADGRDAVYVPHPNAHKDAPGGQLSDDMTLAAWLRDGRDERARADEERGRKVNRRARKDRLRASAKGAVESPERAGAGREAAGY